MEELDALVAKAMADPPPWWDAESRRMGNRAVMSQLGPTREQLGWLRAMISEFREGLDQHHDPISAFEAVRECTALAEALDRMLPPDPVQALVAAGYSDADIPY